MPQWCNVHKQHTVDEVCAGCEREDLRAALQRIMQVLGPSAPECDGCAHEIGEAIRIMNEVGITYQPRKAGRRSS